MIIIMRIQHNHTYQQSALSSRKVFRAEFIRFTELSQKTQKRHYMQSLSINRCSSSFSVFLTSTRSETRRIAIGRRGPNARRGCARTGCPRVPGGQGRRPGPKPGKFTRVIGRGRFQKRSAAYKIVWNTYINHRSLWYKSKTMGEEGKSTGKT